MEEELKKVWITNIQEYRNIYNNWIDEYCLGKHSEGNEDLMWEEFSIYTDNNQLDYQLDPSHMTTSINILTYKNMSITNTQNN